MHDDSFDKLKALREAMVDRNQRKVTSKQCKTCRFRGKHCNATPCNRCSVLQDWCGISEWKPKLES